MIQLSYIPVNENVLRNWKSSSLVLFLNSSRPLFWCANILQSSSPREIKCVQLFCLATNSTVDTRHSLNCSMNRFDFQRLTSISCFPVHRHITKGTQLHKVYTAKLMGKGKLVLYTLYGILYKEASQKGDEFTLMRVCVFHGNLATRHLVEKSQHKPSRL